MSQQNYVVGPEFTFGSTKARLRPSIYIQIGDQRSSSGGMIDHSFDIQIGAGFQIKLQERMFLELTPAEYNLAIVSGSATHASNSYSFGKTVARSLSATSTRVGTLLAIALGFADSSRMIRDVQQAETCARGHPTLGA